MNIPRLRTWQKVAFYTTPLAVVGAAVVACLTLGLQEEMWLRYFGSVVIAHLCVWLPSIPAFRKAPEVSALIWTLFSPVVGLGVFSVLYWPYIWGAWMFGALALIFSYGIPIVVSLSCSIILCRITRSERVHGF